MTAKFPPQDYPTSIHLRKVRTKDCVLVSPIHISSPGFHQTDAGDLKMVTEWKRLGFVLRNPYKLASLLDAPSRLPKYVSVERATEHSNQN